MHNIIAFYKTLNWLKLHLNVNDLITFYVLVHSSMEVSTQSKILYDQNLLFQENYEYCRWYYFLCSYSWETGSHHDYCYTYDMFISASTRLFSSIPQEQ